jgi:hypothetical protein
MRFPHEIKGAAFVTLSRFVTEVHGPDVLASLTAALPPDSRDAIVHLLPSEWHAEDVHQHVLRATFDVVARGRIDRFEEIIADCTLRGVQSFATLVLGMASPEFVLRRAPTLWRVIRRGHASLTVEQTGTMTTVKYRNFPYFGDELYRSYFRALLGALARPSLGHTPPVTLLGHGDDWLDVRLDCARRGS